MRGRRHVLLALGMGAALTGCSVADFEWAGAGSMGTVRSAEWIRFTTTDDYTFTGELTLNYFVLSNVPDLCGAYQDAIADGFDMHTAYLAARQPYQDDDDLNNASLCQLTKDYYANLGAVSAKLTQGGRAYVSTSFGYANIATLGEEGQPQEGIFTMAEDVKAEDGDFFRTYVRFFDDNPYTLLSESMDCASPDWNLATGRDAYTEYRGEPVFTESGEEIGTLQSEIVDDTLVHIAHRDVTAVTAARDRAGLLNTNAEYLLCELRTHEFFLRIFER